MRVVTCKSIDECWLEWWKIAKDNQKLQESRDGDVCWEEINAITELTNPTYNFSHNQIRDMSVRYAMGEMYWYENAQNTLDGIRLYTDAWNRMSDDGKHINSNYGWCIKEKYLFDQFEYCKKMLCSSPESRQAIIHIKTADEKPSKDVNCTVCIQFLIRDNKVHATSYMRSCDLWHGFPYDVLYFTGLQIKLAMALDYEIGIYTHICGSLHLYQRDYIKGKENEKRCEVF